MLNKSSLLIVTLTSIGVSNFSLAAEAGKFYLKAGPEYSISHGKIETESKGYKSDTGGAVSVPYDLVIRGTSSNAANLKQASLKHRDWI